MPKFYKFTKMDEHTCRYGKSSNLYVQEFVKQITTRKPITEIFPPNTFNLCKVSIKKNQTDAESTNENTDENEGKTTDESETTAENEKETKAFQSIENMPAYVCLTLNSYDQNLNSLRETGFPLYNITIESIDKTHFYSFMLNSTILANPKNVEIKAYMRHSVSIIIQPLDQLNSAE